VTGHEVLGSLASEQLRLLGVVYEAFRETRAWPTWQYVEIMVEQEGLPAAAILASLPTIGRRHGIHGFEYGLVWVRGSFGVARRDEDTVGLTATGLFRIGAWDVVETFLVTMAVACQRLHDLRPSPLKPEVLAISDRDVVDELHARRMTVALTSQELYEILDHEPATWSGSRSVHPDGTWSREITRELRRYCGISDVPAYVAAISAAADDAGA
jgi:hypothetical protein